MSPFPRKSIDAPPGLPGTAQTIRWMQDCVAQGKRDHRIRTLAGKLIRNCTDKDYVCYAESVFNYCREQIKYAYDPFGLEYVEHPWRIVEAQVADCDSICILASALCESLGMATEFVTIKRTESDPEFSHVYLRVYLPRGQGYIAMDCTEKDHQFNKSGELRGFGWEPPPYHPRKTWPGSKESAEMAHTLTGKRYSSNGLGGMGCNGDTSCAKCANKNGLAGCMPCLALLGMGGMGENNALSESEQESVLAQIYDGTYGNQLAEKRTALQIESGDSFTTLKEAEKTGDFELVAAAQSYRNKTLQALRDVQDEVTAYNAVINKVNVGIGTYNRTAGTNIPLMKGLGVAPVVAALIAGGLLAGVLTTYYWSKQVSDTSAKEAVNAKAAFVRTLKDAGLSAQQVESIVTSEDFARGSAPSYIEQTGSLVKTLAIVGLFGAAIYAAFNFRKGKR